MSDAEKEAAWFGRLLLCSDIYTGHWPSLGLWDMTSSGSFTAESSSTWLGDGAALAVVGGERLGLVGEEGLLDGLEDTDVEKAFFAVGFGLPVFEDAVGEILQFTAEVIGFLEAFGALFLLYGEDVFHLHADLVGGFGRRGRRDRLRRGSRRRPHRCS